MKTIRTTDIARVIAERYDIELREAIAFVNAMVDVMNDALHYEKLVKVKGLGTFKVTTVGSRESVDVTTGERINIEARDKISFTPDTTLRDRVNAPFSQFETVVVNEGVDFSEIDAQYQPEDENDEVEYEQKEPLQESVMIAPLVTEQRVEEPVEVEEPQPVETSPVEELPVVEEEKMDEPEQPVPSQEDATENKETPRVEPAAAVIPVESEELQQLRRQLDELLDQRSEDQETFRRDRRMFHWLIGSMIVLLLICLGLLLYLYWSGRIVTHVKGYEQPAPSAVVAEPVESVLPDTTELLPDTLQTAEIETEAEAEAEQVAEQAAEPELTAKAEPTSEYDADPRIRLGAYRIVGIDHQVTVVRGQTFKMISKAHLGEGMECYMEAVNPGVRTVKEGDVLNIPKLELKKRTANK